jgi:hypothetical protein
MAYRFQDRLQHANDRFTQVNTEFVTYIRGTIERQISASPILISADELGTSEDSITRTERQDFAINVCELGTLYPPIPSDRIRRGTGEEFILSSMGIDDPPFVHVTSNRTRLIVHTVRSKR